MNRIIFLSLISSLLIIVSCSKETQIENDLKGQWELQSVNGSIIVSYEPDPETGFILQEVSNLSFIEGEMVLKFEKNPEEFDWYGSYDIQASKIVDNETIYTTIPNNGFVPAGSWNIAEETLWLTSTLGTSESLDIVQLDENTLILQLETQSSEEIDDVRSSAIRTETFTFSKIKKLNEIDF
jgi:hypothetical protein